MAALAGWGGAPAWAAVIGAAGDVLGLSPPSPSRVTPSKGVWLCALLLGPLVEEILYRDLWDRALRPRRSAAACLLTSALFALPHPGPWGRLAAFGLGIALASLRRATGSVAICIGYHAGLNAAALASWSGWRVSGAAPPIAALASLLGVGLARRTLRRGPGAILALALAANAAGAEEMVFRGALRFEPALPSFPSPESTGVGVATPASPPGSVGGDAALGALALDAALFSGEAVPVTDPLVSNSGVVAISLPAVPLAASVGPFHPPAPFASAQLTRPRLPIAGELRLCMLLPDCDFPFAMGLQNPDGGGVGVGGILTAGAHGTLMVSLHAAPWTVRSATLDLETGAGASFVAVAAGHRHGPLSFTGSTALPGGEVELVTPIRVESNGSGPVPPSGFVRLAIRFLPEPGSLLLLGAGLAGVGLIGCRRSARRDG